VGKVCGKKKLCRRYPKEKVDKCKKKKGGFILLIFGKNTLTSLEVSLNVTNTPSSFISNTNLPSSLLK
jgi:hypothetical protein